MCLIKEELFMTREQYGIKRLLCILLSVCMIIGLMPMIALPARAEDDPNTIGVLEDDKPRCGNGWAWDGDSTLTLYGAKIAAGSDSVFTYSGGSNITVELLGYNEVSSTAAFAAIGRNTLTISGSGILNIDCPLGSEVVVNSGRIESSCEYLVSTGGQSYLTINGGYVSATGMVEYSRVVMNKGYLDIGSIGTNAGVTAAGGYLKVKDVGDHGAINFQSCVVNITGTVDGTVTAERGDCVLICPAQEGDKVGAGMLGQTVTSDGRRIYCNEFIELDSYDPVPAATVIDAQKAGVFCRNPVNIVDGGSFRGGNYFEMPSGSYAITASGTGSAITADNATIVTSGGNGISLDNAKFGANNTVVTTTGGNNTGITLKSSSTGTGSALIAADSSAYLTGTVSSAGLTDGSEVDGEAYVFSNCHSGSNQYFTLGATANMTIRNSSDKSVKIADGAAINGSLTYAATDKNLTISQNAVIADDSKIAAYVDSESGCNIFNFNERFIPTHTFYYAENIGSEFRTTTDTGFSCHKAKAVYYGKELQPRLDADEYKDSSGNFVSSDDTMSAGKNPYADETGLFVISSSTNIASLSGELTASLITPYGQTSENAAFTFENGGNGNSKRILVKMKLSGTLIPGDGYKVRVEHGGKTCEFPLTLTNVFYTPEMDFTAGAGAWTYNNGIEVKSFTGKDTNVKVDDDTAKWKWYGAPANDDGYDRYTLVLNNFDGMGDHPIKLPAGSTIILKGLNTVTTQGCGILCEGGSLIITRDSLETGYLICKAGENGDDTSAIKVTGDTLKIDGVTVDISVEGTQFANYAVHAEYSFVIHDAIVTLNNLNTASGDAVRATEMFLGGTSTLTAQAHENIISSFFKSARATSIDNVTCFSTDPTLDEYNESCKEDSDSPWLSCKDKTKPLKIVTKGLTVDKTTVHLPVNTGANTWNVLKDYLTINYGSGNFVLLDKDGAVNAFKNKDGVSSIQLRNGVIIAEFAKDFAGGEDNAITLYLNEYIGELRGDAIPIKVIFDRYYTVTANSTGSGSVTFADGYTSDRVISGGSIAYDITPVAGNKITKITYNSEDITDKVDKYAGGTFTLENITSDGTLDVEFGPLETFTFNVDGDSDHLTCSTNVSPDEQGGFTEGTEITVTLIPDSDWEITSVTLNGVKLPLTADNKYTFTITENTTLVVEMEYLIKTVAVNKTGEGTAESSAATVTKGGDVEFTVIPADGWRIGSARLNNEDVKAQIGADGKLTVSNVTDDITLDVVFVEMSKYALDVVIPHGSYTADPAGLSYVEGTQVTVTLTTETDWAITSVKLNGAELALTADNRYTFAMTENSTLSVETEYLIKTVTVDCGKGGTVDPMTAQVRKGGQATFTITPDSGYGISSVTLDGVRHSAVNNTLTLTVTKDCTLAVRFSRNGGSGGSTNSGGGSSGSDSSQPCLSADSSVSGWAAIKESLAKLTDGRAEIMLNGASYVPEYVLEAVKGRNITLVFRTSSTAALEIDARSIKTAAAISAEVKTSGTLPAEIQAQVKGTAFPLTADGSFCGNAALVLNVGRENAGKVVTLMLIKDGRAAGISAARAAADGTVRVALPEGGSYAVAISGASQLLGDVNGDMSVTIADALALLKHVMAVEELPADAIERGDIRGTGKPDISDAKTILQYSFGTGALA